MSKEDKPRCSHRHPTTGRQCAARVYQGNRHSLCFLHLKIAPGGVDFIVRTQKAQQKRRLARKLGLSVTPGMSAAEWQQWKQGVIERTRAAMNAM